MAWTAVLWHGKQSSYQYGKLRDDTVCCMPQLERHAGVMTSAEAAFATLVANQVKEAASQISAADVCYTKGRQAAYTLRVHADQCAALGKEMDKHLKTLQRAVITHQDRTSRNDAEQLAETVRQMQDTCTSIASAVSEMRKAAERLTANKGKRHIWRIYYGRKDQEMAGWRDIARQQADHFVKLFRAAEALVHSTASAVPLDERVHMPEQLIEDIMARLQPGQALLLHGAPGMGKSTIVSYLQVCTARDSINAVDISSLHCEVRRRASLLRSEHRFGDELAQHSDARSTQTKSQLTCNGI